MKTVRPNKRVIYFAFIFICCLFLFFTNDFGLVDIRKTAIITAVGVDEAEDGLMVSALIAVPQPSADSKSTTETVVSGTGKTVSFALSEIADKTGWVPKLVFCQTVIIGESLTSSDVMTALEYFIRDEYMSDSCMIACARGKAADILSVSSPTDSLTGVALSSVLGNEANQSGKATVINLKDFAVGYYGGTRSSYMPIIERASSVESDGEEAESAASSESGEGDEQGGSGAQGLFKTTSTAMFLSGVKVGELDAEETFMFNVLRTKLRFAVFNAESDGKLYSLGLRHNAGKIRFSINSNTPQLFVDVRVNATVADTDFAEDIGQLMYSSVVPDSVKAAAEERMEALLSGIFEKCRSTGCDLFRVIDKLKRFENNYYEAYKNDVLRLCLPTFKVTIVSDKKN